MSTTIPLPPSDISLDELYRLLRPVTVDRSSSAAVFQNWGHTFRCRPSSVFRPETERQVELILQLARREKQTVRAVGIGHSPSDLACTSGYMIQMHRLDEIIEVRYRRISLSYLLEYICRSDAYPVAFLEPRDVRLFVLPSIIIIIIISRHRIH